MIRPGCPSIAANPDRISTFISLGWVSDGYSMKAMMETTDR